MDFLSPRWGPGTRPCDSRPRDFLGLLGIIKMGVPHTRMVFFANIFATAEFCVCRTLKTVRYSQQKEDGSG